MSHRGGRGGGPGGRGRGRVSADTDPSPRGGRGTRGRGGRSGGGGGSGRGNISTIAPPPAASGQAIGVPTAQPPASSGHVIGVPTAQPPSSSSPSVHEIGASSSSTATDLGKKMEQSLTLQQPAISSQISSGSALPPPVSSKSQNLPRRPGPGTVGKVCVVRANHFLVSVADKNIHHYDVLIKPEGTSRGVNRVIMSQLIKPEVTSRGVNRKIMSQLIELYSKSHLGNRQPVYDGRKSLFTAGPLPFISEEFVIDLNEKEDQSKSKRRERKFHVVIKLVSQPDLHQLRQFLSGRQNDAPYETIQALDIVLRESPTRMYTVVGRSFFSPNLGPTGRIGDGLEYWTGYYQSIRATQMGLSLNIDVSLTSFYEPLIVTEYVCSFLNIRDLSRPLSDTDRVKIEGALKDVKVQLTHRENIVRKKISGITSQPVSQLMFPNDDTGATESVLHYFNQKYGVVLKYPHLPCLKYGSDSKPVYLPMEVCRIVEGQRYSEKLSEKQVTGLLKAACKRPPDREASIREMVAYNNYKQDNFAAEFGISITDRLTTIPNARVLPAPMLKYHDSGREVKVQPRVGQWNMINAKMVNGGKVETWACINFSNLKPDGAIRFFEELVAMCCSKGMVFSPNPIIPIRSVRPNQIESSLRALHKEAAVNSKGKQLQLLIIILPDYSGSYGKIKRICETELGIVSQCCQPKQAYKLNKQYLENVSLKINVKVGGRNTVLEDALLRKIPLVSDRPTIIFGADVTHPGRREDSPSIAAVVASMDWPEVTRYRCLVSAQPSRREMIDDLYKLENDPQRGPVHGGMIREHLIAFRKSTGFKPHRIIFYRDGVSEGQFSEVLLYEIDAIRKACASLEDGYLPPITFVVVQKRHHTRLFPNNHNDRNSTDRSGNILPGTVVDTMICHPTEFDFYLCSHAGIQGTSRPTHYHVLWDENKFSSDALQTLTNNLTYTYARCTRSVSIVPPAYYAHLGAFRARHYIEGDISDSGSSVGGSKSKGERSSVVRPLPKILDSVKDVMFYC